jgi:hypothetical protein
METRKIKINFKELANPKLQKQHTEQTQQKSYPKKAVETLIENLNSEIMERFVKRKEFFISGRIPIDRQLFEQLHQYHGMPVQRLKDSINETFFQNIKVQKIYKSLEDTYMLRKFKCCVQKKHGVKYRLSPNGPQLQTKMKYFFRYIVQKKKMKERNGRQVCDIDD